MLRVGGPREAGSYYGDQGLSSGSGRGAHKIIMGLVPELTPGSKRAMSLVILSLPHSIRPRVLSGNNEMVLSTYPKQVKGRL